MFEPHGVCMGSVCPAETELRPSCTHGDNAAVGVVSGFGGSALGSADGKTFSDGK